MIIVITGPTGVGKTKLSISLAKHYKAIVINADAMQVYKGLDIGTSKVTDAEKEGIPHFLLDIKEIDEPYTAYMYQQDIRALLAEYKNSNIIIVGGTGLYIKAGLYDYNFKTESGKNKLLYKNVKFIGLTLDRKILYERINERVDKMVELGLLEEVKKYYDSKIKTKPLLNGIGYKELYSYFDGVISLNEALNKIKQNSRKYAKRQYTWFNHQMNIKWFDVNLANFNETIENVITYLNS